MTAQRLTDTLTPWFAKAFHDSSMKERVTWEVVFGVAQTPQGAMPQLLIYASIPAATLGSSHALFAQMGGVGVTEEVVDRDVRKMVEALLEMRTRELYQSNGHGGAPTSMPWPPPKG